MTGGTAQRARLLEGAMAKLCARPTPATTFKAWRIIGSEGEPVEIDANSLDEALNQAKVKCIHKQMLVILETTPRRSVQHTYRIKKSTTKGWYRRSFDGGPNVFEGALIPDLVLSLEVNSFAPTETYRWTADNPMGLDRQLVEQR